jgi:hypothetical protein
MRLAGVGYIPNQVLFGYDENDDERLDGMFSFKVFHSLKYINFPMLSFSSLLDVWYYNSHGMKIGTDYPDKLFTNRVAQISYRLPYSACEWMYRTTKNNTVLHCIGVCLDLDVCAVLCLCDLVSEAFVIVYLWFLTLQEGKIVWYRDGVYTGEVKLDVEMYVVTFIVMFSMAFSHSIRLKRHKMLPLSPLLISMFLLRFLLRFFLSISLLRLLL